MAGTTRHALVLNLHGDGPELETNLSTTFQDLDEWGDEPDPGHELRVHAARAAADDVQLLSRVLRGVGYTVSVPSVTSDLTQLKRHILDARNATRPVVSVPTTRDPSRGTSPLPVPADLTTVPSGTGSTPTADDMLSDPTSTDGVPPVPLLLVVVVGAVFGHNPDSTSDDVDTSRIALPSERNAPPAGVLHADLVDWIRSPDLAHNVSTLAIFDISTTVQSAFRAHVGDDAGNDSTPQHSPADIGRSPGVGGEAAPVVHFSISGFHFVMYSAGQTLVNLALNSFAGVRGTNSLTVGQLIRDVDRRASRCSHFAGPTYDGPRGSSLVVAGGSSLAALAAQPSSQPSPFDRFDVVLTLKDRQLESYRVIDTLLDAANDFGAQPTMRVHGVEWGVTVTLESEGASEDVLRRNVLQHLSRVWDLPESRVADVTSVSHVDAANECLVFVRHEQHRLGRALVKHLLMSTDPCLGRFAVFQASVSVDIRLRASVAGLLLVMSRVRGAQFMCALGMQTWAATLDWAPVADPEDMSRPQSANAHGRTAILNTSAGTAGGRDGSAPNSTRHSVAHQPSWNASSFLPGLVQSGPDAVGPAGGGTAQADHDDGARASHIAALRATLVLQRVGRGCAARRESLWTAIGVPRDPYLYALALTAAEWDAEPEGTHPGPISAGEDLRSLLAASAPRVDVAAIATLAVVAAIADAVFAVCMLHVARAVADAAGAVTDASSARSLPTSLLRAVCAAVAAVCIGGIASAQRGSMAYAAVDLVERLVVHPAASLSQRRRLGCLAVSSLEEAIGAVAVAADEALAIVAAGTRAIASLAVVVAVAVAEAPEAPLLPVLLIAGFLVAAMSAAVAGDAAGTTGVFWLACLSAGAVSIAGNAPLPTTLWCSVVAVAAATVAGGRVTWALSAASTGAPALHLAQRLLSSPAVRSGVPTAPTSLATEDSMQTGPPTPARSTPKAGCVWAAGILLLLGLVAAVIVAGSVGITCPDVRVACGYRRPGTDEPVHRSGHHVRIAAASTVLRGCENAAAAEAAMNACPDAAGWDVALVPLGPGDEAFSDRSRAALPAMFNVNGSHAVPWFA